MNAPHSWVSAKTSPHEYRAARAALDIIIARPETPVAAFRCDLATLEQIRRDQLESAAFALRLAAQAEAEIFALKGVK